MYWPTAGKGLNISVNLNLYLICTLDHIQEANLVLLVKSLLKKNITLLNPLVLRQYFSLGQRFPVPVLRKLELCLFMNVSSNILKKFSLKLNADDHTGLPVVVQVPWKICLKPNYFPIPGQKN